MLKITAVVTTLLTLTGCSSDENNQFLVDDVGLLDVSRFLNGNTFGDATSFWQCATVIDQDRFSFLYSAWGNGRGTSTDKGGFAWEATPSNIEGTADDGTTSIIFDLQHSKSFDEMTFREYYFSGVTGYSSCVRVSL